MKDYYGDFDEISEDPNAQYLPASAGRTPIQPDSERFVNDLANIGQTSVYG